MTIGTAALFVCGVGADSPSPDFTAVPWVVVVVEVPIVVEREGGGARLGRSDVVVAFAAFPFPITVDDCWEVPDLSSLPNRREKSVS